MVLSVDPLVRAREALSRAEAVILCTGAGMGVDSGLPDFRGDEGFWRAYPPMRALGLSFAEMAQPRWFDEDPALAWGFYGHRAKLYRDTVPHEGHAALLRAIGDRPAFAITSNVDGQLLRAGWAEARLIEIHGRIAWLQCTQCRTPAWHAPDLDVHVDPTTFRARGPLPRCPECDAMARPNVLMFGDWGWEESVTDLQQLRWDSWQRGVTLEDTVVLECGAGTSIPSIRRTSERLLHQGATLVRINVREADGPAGTISLAMGAKDALVAMTAV